ncbi:MAG: carboxylesterase family protein [Planctomycetota bacterium]
MRIFLLLLASTDLTGLVGEYLRSAPGSEKEAAALAAIRPYYEADPEAVEEVLRNRVAFPAAAPGMKTVSVPLPGSGEGKTTANPAAVWVPKGYDPKRKWPVLLVLHGQSGHAEAVVQALSGFADRHGILLVGPQDTVRAGGGGWGYTDREHRIHVESLRWLKRTHNVDDARVFVQGGSRGGHGTWDLAYTYPDLFAGAVPVVGSILNRKFRFLPNLLHVPVFDMQGAKDDPIAVEHVRDAVKLLRGWKYDVRYDEDEKSGHFYPVDWEEVWSFLKDRRRPTYPKRVIRVATHDDRSRAYWLRLANLPTRKFEKPKPARRDPRRAYTRDELKKLVRENYAKYAARVEAKVSRANEIRLTANRAPKVVLLLHDDLVDLDEKVTILVNGRVRRKAKVTRSLETLLGLAKETGERERLFHAAVEVRGAN